MISSLCNTISLNYLACQRRVARSPIHVRATFKKLACNLLSLLSSLFLSLSRFKILHVLFMPKFNHAVHTRTSHTIIRIFQGREYKFLFAALISLFFLDASFSYASRISFNKKETLSHLFLHLSRRRRSIKNNLFLSNNERN